MTLRGGELVVPARPGVHERPARGRDQPHAAEDAGGAARGDAGAAGDDRRRAAAAARPVPRVATQNPIEYEGTYPLPEAQLDRFLLQGRRRLPRRGDRAGDPGAARTAASRRRRSTTSSRSSTPSELRAGAGRGGRDRRAATRWSTTSRRSCAATRELPSVELGASPRAARAPARRGARRSARLDGRGFVTPDDVVAVAPAVLRHRLDPAPRGGARALPARRRDRGRAAVRARAAMSPTRAHGARCSPRSRACALVCCLAGPARRGSRSCSAAAAADAASCAPAGRASSASVPRDPRARRRRRGSRLDARRRRAGRVRLRQPAPPDLAARSPARPTARSRRRSSAAAAAATRCRRPPSRVDGPARARLRGTTGPARTSDGARLPRPAGGAAPRRRGPPRPLPLRGQARAGPLGLGTEFESIREYAPDDDVRQVNWRATRAARPADVEPVPRRARPRRHLPGRLRAADGRAARRPDAARRRDRRRGRGRRRRRRARRPLRRDRVRRRAAPARCAPRRGGRPRVVQALFDLEPVPVDSDYEAAFAAVGEAKRACVLVFTDLLERDRGAAAARRAADARAPPRGGRRDRRGRRPRAALTRAAAAARVDVYRAAVALDVAGGARPRRVALLRRAGVDVIEAPPERLAAACVRSYLRAKARARL